MDDGSCKPACLLWNEWGICLDCGLPWTLLRAVGEPPEGDDWEEPPPEKCESIGRLGEMMNSHAAALHMTVNAYQSTLDKDVLDAMTGAAAEINRLEQEHEATKLRLDAANESLAGCAQRVQSLSSKLDEVKKERDALQEEIDGQEQYELCDCCGCLSIDTTDVDGVGNPLGHSQCENCGEIAALESKLETRTETLRQFADAVVRAPIDCDCMDCYKERREVRGRAEKMMEALDND